jgi:hypothetical protein
MMVRRSILAGSAMTALALALLATGVTAQQPKGQPKQQQQPPQPPKPMKELIVGSWTLLIIDGIQADGTKMPLYGPNPKGLIMFSADGHYSQQIMRDIRPKYAANDRLKGTPDEMKAAITGMNTQFGTYVIDEPNKTITFRIEGSSYPNWDGTTQKRTITALVGDEFTYTAMPGTIVPSLGLVRTEIAWHRLK